jgi:hypothetical protein
MMKKMLRQSAAPGSDFNRETDPFTTRRQRNPLQSSL